MSSISSVRVSPLAYKKLILHTAKYPTARVLGLLLADTTSSSNLTITDSIPLSHHWTALAPMAEAALSLASAFASSKNLAVVGLYEAPELVSDRNVSQQASKLAEKIATLVGKEALLLHINNATLLSPNNHSLSGFTVAANTSTGGKGEAKAKQLQESAVLLQDSAKAKELEGAVREERTWEKLVDFDGKFNHTRIERADMFGSHCLHLAFSQSCRPPRGSIIGLAAELRHHCVIAHPYSVHSLKRPHCIPF